MIKHTPLLRCVFPVSRFIFPMDRITASLLGLLLFVCLLPAAMAGMSADSPSVVNSKVGDAEVQVKAWLDPDERIVVSQQVKLYIEVSVNGWFSAGTRFGAWSVDNAIALQAEQFAVNSTRREAGETWAVQLWTMIIYPQQAGNFELPAIPLSLTVTRPNEKGEPNTATATISSPVISFAAGVPPSMKGKHQWLATTRLEVTEHYDKASDSLKPGDSLQRTVHFEADNVAAMMLPEPVFETVKGVSIYPKPSKIEDTINRGEYLAERTESVSYVVEASGEYRLPALSFYWWDLNAQQLQSITLPGRVISTTGTGKTLANSTTADARESAWTSRSILMFLAAIVALAMVIVALRRWLLPFILRKKEQSAQRGNVVSLETLQKQYESACREQRYSEAVSLLYRWLDHPSQCHAIDVLEYRTGGVGSVREWLSAARKESPCRQLDEVCQTFDELMSASYGETAPANASFESLLRAFSQLFQPEEAKRIWTEPVDLRLN